MTTDHSTNRDAFGYWLSGFVDGEGMLMLAHSHHKTYCLPHARFEIHLRLDDRDILEEIQSFLGVGTFYDRPERIHGSEKARSRPQLCYRVSRAQDLATVIVPHFEHYPLRAKKRNDFAIWKQGVELLYQISCRRTQRRNHGYGTYPRWTESELAKFKNLHDLLRSQRKFEAPILDLPTVLPANGDQLRLWI